MKNVQETIREAATQRGNLLAELRNDLNAAKEAQAKAEEMAGAAIESGDLETYENAKANARTAADRIEFYGAQIKKNAGLPLFENSAERADINNAIKAQAEKTKAEKLAEAAELINKAYRIIKCVQEEIADANKYLETVAEHTGKRAKTIDTIALGTLAGQVRAVINHSDLQTDK